MYNIYICDIYKYTYRKAPTSTTDMLPAHNQICRRTVFQESLKLLGGQV